MGGGAHRGGWGMAGRRSTRGRGMARRRSRGRRGRRSRGGGGGPSRRGRRDRDRRRPGRDRRALSRHRRGANAKADGCADRRGLVRGEKLGNQPVPAGREVPEGEGQAACRLRMAAVEDELDPAGPRQPHPRQHGRSNRRPRLGADDGDSGRSDRSRCGGHRCSGGRRRGGLGRGRLRLGRPAPGDQGGNYAGRHRQANGGNQSHPRAWCHGGSRTKTPRRDRSFPAGPSDERATRRCRQADRGSCRQARS
jgi:hypothetical protein